MSSQYGPPSDGWTVRKVWDVGTAPPRIEIVKRVIARGKDLGEDGPVVQTLAFTRANSAWAARWIVDYMEKLHWHYDGGVKDRARAPSRRRSASSTCPTRR